MYSGNMRRSRYFAALALLAICLLPGCGSRVRVQGAVTFDGQPLDGGRIHFLPERDPPGRNSVHATLVQGNYSLPVPGGPEVGPGRHRVEIVLFKQPPSMEHLKAGDPGWNTDHLIQVLPAIYNSKTTLFVDLERGTNTLDFALKKKP